MSGFPSEVNCVQRDPSDQGADILYSYFFSSPVELLLTCLKIHLLHRKKAMKAMKHEITVGREQRSRKGRLRVFSFSVSLLSPSQSIHSKYSIILCELPPDEKIHKKPTVLQNADVFIPYHTCPLSYEKDTVLHCLMQQRTGMLSLLTIITDVVKPRSI